MPTRRNRPGWLRALTAVVAIAGAGATIALSQPAAYAYNPCMGPRPPSSCDDDPTPTPPAPPPAYRIDYSKPLDSTQAMPVNNGYGEHVYTTVRIKRQYSTSTGQETAEWVASDYKVVNDLAFQGFHVDVHERLYTTVGYRMDTNTTTIGVTPKFFDPDHATAQVSVLTPVPVGWGDSLYMFQPVDAFRG